MTGNPEFSITTNELDPNRPRVVVRISTSWWHDSHGLHERRDIRYLRRKCQTYNFVAEDASCASARDTIASIINLRESTDGVYEILMTNISRDHECGEIDGYDFKLVPYIP